MSGYPNDEIQIFTKFSLLEYPKLYLFYEKAKIDLIIAADRVPDGGGKPYIDGEKLKKIDEEFKIRMEKEEQ